MNDRKTLYRKHKQTGNLADFRSAQHARNRVNCLLQNAKAEYIKQTLNTHKDDPKKFWRVLNENLLKGSKCMSDIIFDKGDNECTNIPDACVYLNEFFAGIGKRLHSQFNTDLRNRNYNAVYNIDSSDDVIQFELCNIIKIVKDIDINKGSGIDFIPTFILKDVFEEIPQQLTYLFNQSLALGIFPETWAIATITPVPKTGNLLLSTNWRPISIIPLIGKLLEKLCNSALCKHLELHNILCDEQYGFRPKRSTGLAIFKFLKNIISDINNKKIVGALYLDFSKAFDSINHWRLKEKLQDMGIPRKLLWWIGSYLRNRKIQTRLNNVVSNTADLICGVPQGSVLGPTLFLCFINDLSMTTNDLGLNISLYADDAVIYYSSHEPNLVKERLEVALSHIIEWCNQNYININIDKTKFCIYGNRSPVSHFKENTISSNNKCIYRCQQYQYLGVILDECLTLKQNFNNILKRFSGKIYQFGKIKKFLGIETRVLVYKQTILPLTEYVSFVMCLNNKTDRDKLQKLQNRALRMCYNIQNPRDMSTQHMHSMANVELLEKRRLKQLMCIIYDIATLPQPRIRLQNTRLATKYNVELELSNTQLYTRSPYHVGGQIWNKLPKKTQEQKTKESFKLVITDAI